MREFAVYTAARFGLFLVVFAVVLGGFTLITGWPPPILGPLLVAAIVSMVLATYLLRDLRDRLAAQMQGRVERSSARPDETPPGQDAD